MGLVVAKYPLQSLTDVAVVAMASTARVIRLSIEKDVPHLWAIIHTDDTAVLRAFKMIPTGFEIPDGSRYVDSLTMRRGGEHFAFHFFEIAVPEGVHDDQGSDRVFGHGHVAPAGSPSEGRDSRIGNG
jgi:hypothetical protein